MATHYENTGAVTAAGTLSITTGGTAQTVFTATGRNYLLVVNNSAYAQTLTIDGSTPSATNGIYLAANGGSFVAESSFIPNGAVKIWCNTTGATFYAVQG
jgi:hypothetical protein